MKHARNFQDVSVHVPPRMWNEFSKSMLKCRTINEEVIGFFFCRRHQVCKNRVRYIATHWVVPTPDCYERQSANGLALKQSFHTYLLENYLSQELDVIHIHTHADESLPSFSGIDDRYESIYAKFLSSHFKNKPRLISGVFNESLQKSKFRIWDRKGLSFQNVRFNNTWFDVSIPSKINMEAPVNIQTQNPQKYYYSDIFDEDGEYFDNTDELVNSNQLVEHYTDLMFARQKVFGETNQKHLNQIKVALIGCGGIGSIFAELLSRLGVKNWVLIDPDRLETLNLNRMPAATQEMVEQRWHKVHYVKHLIKQVYCTGSTVKTIPNTIQNITQDKSAIQEIATSDLIVVATDNHLSRKVAQELALQYMRPLVCLGTHIDVKPDNTPRMFCRVTIPPLGGDWCLMCGNIISLQRAALESAPIEINQMAASAGYLEGVNDPAVFWLNSICASTGVGAIHGMVSGFLNVDAGIDWIYEFPSCTWHKTNIEFLANSDCYFCS